MAYFLRRLGFFVLTLWAAVTLNFVIPRLSPGDPAQAIVAKLAGEGRPIDPAQLRAVRLMIGAPGGDIATQYWQYLGTLVHGQFGVSYEYFPYSVTHMILGALPWTLVLVGVTNVISFVGGTALGAAAAWKRNSRFDGIVSVGSTFLGTLPFFWIALLLIYVFAFSSAAFPASGGFGGDTTPGLNLPFLRDAAYHSVLPALSILIVGPIGWILGMRNTMVQSLGEDFTRFAKAKGLRERRIAWAYGARVAILPNVTGFAISLGGILGGTVLIETIFGYPGLGRLFYQAVSNRDYPLMQTLFLFTTAGILVANLVADVLYGVLDPRVRRQEAA